MPVQCAAVNPPPPAHTNAPTASGGRDRPVRALAEALDRVRDRLRWLIILRAAASLVAGGLIGLLAIGLIDLGLHLPAVARGVLLVAGLGGVAIGAKRLVLPAARWRMSRSALAHRLEQLQPQHAGTIASAVDMLDLADQPGETGSMARAVVAQASGGVAQVRAASLIRYTGVFRSLALLLGTGAVLGALALISPVMTGIGAQRVLAPWTDARWPTRFGITDLTETGVHPIDEALPIRVSIGPGDARAKVRVEWRTASNPEIQRAPMTAQPATASDARPYERLVDPARIARSVAQTQPEDTLRYRIITPDDQSAWKSVRLVRPPEVISASAEITPPAHATGAPGLANFRTGTIELPTGDASLGPVLGGSNVTLTWTFSSDVSPLDPETWSQEPVEITQPDARTVRVTLMSESPARIGPRVQDKHALGVRLPVSAGVDIRPDGVPSVQIARPGSDQIVTPQARIDTLTESSDEVGVVAVTLEAARWSRPEDSAGAPLEPSGDAVTIAEAAISGGVQTRAELEAEFTPESLDAKPGDEIVLAGVAMDTRGTPGLVRSQPRRLRVVSPEDFAARLRAQLDPIAGLLRRADDDQRNLIERNAATDRDSNSIARAQVSLGDTIGAARQAVRELSRDAQANRLDDPALNSMLRDVDRALDEAVDAARAAARLTDGNQPREATQQQQRVRERLGEAMAMLDRGSDAYLARRAISRLREQLEEAQRGTSEVGQRTAGQRDDEISRDDRAELDRLSEAQRDLSDRAREALEELSRRADALERDDPAQAEALRRAAESGRAGDLASVIQQGGQQTEQNQTGQAQESQQQALEQLEEMLEQIDSAAGLRDTALRRKLADLMQSIEALIIAQKRALGELARAQDSGDTRGLSGGMIALRDNTLGVIEDASAALSELRLIAEALRDAERAQTDAITALRLEPPSLDNAQVSEELSLSLLEQALEEAKRQDDQAEQREQDRRKAELRKAYREALQAQSALRDDSQPLLGRPLSRRERIESRRLSAGQRDLAATLEEIRAGTEELAEAPIFELAHDQLDILMRAASDALAESTPPESIALDQENAVAMLASLVEVLGDESPGGNEDFQDGSGGEGGGSGGEGEQPLIPPVAELRLLRDMQRAAMTMTRRISETPALRQDAARTARLADLQRLLAERGSGLIERMNQPPAPPSTPGDPPPPDPSQPDPESGQPDESPERIEPGAGSSDGGL